MTIPVVVISLRRSSDRRVRIVEQMRALGIQFRFFDAIDAREKGALVEHGSISYLGHYNRRLTDTEIACTLSHFAVICSIAEGVDEFVCVLEDDASIAPDFCDVLQERELNALPAFDVLRVCRAKRWTKRGFEVARIGEHEIWAPIQAGVHATGQIYSRAGAKKIAKSLLPIRGPFDNVLYRDARIPRLRMLELRPAVVKPSGVKSTIGPKPPAKKTWSTAIRRKLFLFRCYVASLANFIGAWRCRSLRAIWT